MKTQSRNSQSTLALIFFFIAFAIDSANCDEIKPSNSLPDRRQLSFQLHLWQRQPNRIPHRIAPVITIEIEIERPAGPGLMQISKRPWNSSNDVAAKGELQVAWAYPESHTQLPEYFNIQLTIEKPFRAQCAMTPKVDDIGVPSLLCNQWPEDPKHDVQLGATLIDQRVIRLP